MNFKQALRMAIKSLRSSKMRAFLTMLGIIIGVASVIVLVSLMNGLSSDMTSSFESMGTNTITVNITGRGGNRALDVNDIESLIDENSEKLASYSPMVNAQATVKKDAESVSTSASGVNEQYKDLNNITLSSGRFIQYIDSERRQNVCVIGTYIAEELFGSSDVIGETLKINGYTYSVIGLIEETDDSTEGSGDDIIYIPYSTATRLAMNANISTYVIQAVDTKNIEETVAIIEAKLYSIFEDENAYRVTSMSAMIDQINEMTGTISLVLVGIAGISLVVGGIGIMNIMLVSVTERTREIGIRKALGAKRKSIMSQFIIEAATTSSFGGVIGIILGIVLAYVAGALMDMTVAPSVGSVLLAFGVSVGIGMIFGYFPAGKAASKNPIDALRYD